jgi:hypothetical protein
MQKKSLELGQLFWSYADCKMYREHFSQTSWRWLICVLVLWFSSTSLAQSDGGAKSSDSARSLTDILVPQPARLPGQSATQLPDGRWLLLGGLDQDNSPSSDATVLKGKVGAVAPLSAKLNQARSGHTATLLPNGTVLILGGVDATGAVLTTAEQFNPATGQFRVLGELSLIARTGHTATVLADGNLLISGGVDQHAHAIYQSEIFHPLTGKVESFSIKLNAARMNHLAALLPNADVL